MIISVYFSVIEIDLSHKCTYGSLKTYLTVISTIPTHTNIVPNNRMMTISFLYLFLSIYYYIKCNINCNWLTILA